MKLVELLARDMNEWPDDLDTLAISQDRRTGMNLLDSGVEPHDAAKMPDEWDSWPSETWTSFSDLNIDQVADDYRTAIVTRAQWQAERDRQKGGEWKRHRGNSQPVDEGTWVEVKLRCGDIQQGLANAFLWRHADCDVAANIMKYRVISQAQAEEVEKEVFVGKDVKLEYAFSEEGVSMEDLDWKPIGGKLTSVEGVDLALFGEVEDVQLRDTLSTYKEFTVTGQWHQIEGPFKWRDEVTELNAYIEEFTRERDALIERLASEGFSLIPKVVSVVSEFSGADMSDWRNWKAGDSVTYIHTSTSSFTDGWQYTLEEVDEDRVSIERDDEGDANGWLTRYFKWHSRP